jgi:hypothetical protein
MARPARVFMRSRKPWVFARRRVFGWKVRLLITILQLKNLGNLVGVEDDLLLPPIPSETTSQI